MESGEIEGDLRFEISEGEESGEDTSAGVPMARCELLKMAARARRRLEDLDMGRLLGRSGEGGVRKHSRPLQREGRDQTGGAFCPVRGV